MVALVAGSFGFQPSTAQPEGPPVFDGGPTDFVTVSDGTSIALNVVIPEKCMPEPAPPVEPEPGGCPAILEMAGYENGSSDKSGRTTTGQLEDWYCDSFHADPDDCERGAPLTGDSHEGTSAFRYDADYVLVHASVRGTGCSAGEFDLFSSRSAMDGYEIIENYIVDNTTHGLDDVTAITRSAFVSNGKVGILGHSYSGMTGFMIAAQEGKAARDNDPNTTSHLEAVSVSGLIDDVYRGITYPGGVPNMLFPPLWTLGVRPAYDVLGGTLQGIVRNADDHPEIAARCAANTSTHRKTATNDPVVQGIADTDNDWWRARSLVSWAPFIAAPIHTAGAFQDEQTGPRFPHLWETIPNDTPKRLLMSNGNHGTQVGPAQMWQDRKAWMDYWMRGLANPFVPDPDDRLTSVRTLLEFSSAGSNGIKDSTSFPLEDTDWTPYFLCADNTATTDGTDCDGGALPYVSGSKRQSWSYQADDGYNGFGSPFTTHKAPDELNFTSAPLSATGSGVSTLIDGPITANLHLASTANDFDIFVQIADRAPDGTVAILQRGLLKASHEKVDYLRSDYDEANVDPYTGTGQFLYRPFRAHTNAIDVTPLDVNEYLVEIFPVAHVFRPGHALQIKIMGAPAVDSYYAYVPKQVPLAINTLHLSGDTPSRITLPVVPLTGVVLGPPRPCGQITQYRCVTD